MVILSHSLNHNYKKRLSFWVLIILYVTSKDCVFAAFGGAGGGRVGASTQLQLWSKRCQRIHTHLRTLRSTALPTQKLRPKTTHSHSLKVQPPASLTQTTQSQHLRLTATHGLSRLRSSLLTLTVHFFLLRKASWKLSPSRKPRVCSYDKQPLRNIHNLLKLNLQWLRIHHKIP